MLTMAKHNKKKCKHLKIPENNSLINSPRQANNKTKDKNLKSNQKGQVNYKITESCLKKKDNNNFSFGKLGHIPNSKSIMSFSSDSEEANN